MWRAYNSFRPIFMNGSKGNSDLKCQTYKGNIVGLYLVQKTQFEKGLDF